jgi:hypothetical protein
MESLWLLTRAWNTGILLYSLAQYPEAEKWCGLGISFIRHLGSLQESYQTQVQEPGRRGLRGWGRVREMSEAELEVVAVWVCSAFPSVSSGRSVVRAGSVEAEDG